MASTALTKNTFANSKEVRYLNKTFPQFRQSLIDFAKVYYPDSYNDFNETSPGMIFIEMVAYASDVLSYYTDSQFKESLLEYAQEQDNILAMSQAFGYKPKPKTAATTQLDVYQLCPALDLTGNYEPDPKYFLRLDSGMIVSAPQYGVQFRTTDVLDFKDETDRSVTVYAVDGLNKPLTYLIKKTVQVTSGTVKTYQQVFTTPQKFSKITLAENNILEIIDVEDSNGYKWYQVDYLGQDLIFEDNQNLRSASTNESLAPFYLLKVRRTSRRFTTQYNNEYFLELNFGSGVLDDSDARINLEPNKVASDEYQTNLGSTALDPSDFLSSNSYGLAPSNVQLTITYVVGGGLESNVPSNSITKLDSVNVLNSTSGLNPTESKLFADIRATLAVNNGISATGGKEAESIEEIRQNALAFFNAQNRLVTPEDYIVRCYAMPGKFGGVAKVFVAREDQIMAISRANNSQAPIDGTFVSNAVGQNKVNLYILGYDKYKKLTTLNADTKQNLKSYLENYRILTDEINIMDAFVINIGVKFNIIVYRNFNMNEVLARAIDSIRQFFDVTSWDINQPIVLNDVMLTIASVDGVQSVTSLKIFNRYGFLDGSDYGSFLYDIDAATDNGVVFPSLDPSVFELRYPERDIIGNATQ